MNTLKISGTVYRATQRTTSTGKPMTTFGLMFANKKMPDGKFKGSFVNIKCFKEIDLSLIREKTKVVVDGFLGYSEYTNKEGKLITGLEVIANSITHLEEKTKVDESRLPEDNFCW